MEGGGVSMRKGKEGQRALEIVVSRDMPNHEFPPPLSPPPKSDAAAESENLRSSSSGNGSSRYVPTKEILVNLFARPMNMFRFLTAPTIMNMFRFLTPPTIMNIALLQSRDYKPLRIGQESRDMPNHESLPPRSPPPKSDAAAESEKLLIFLGRLVIILFLPLILLVLGARAFFGIDLFKRGKEPGGKKGIFEIVGENYKKVEEFLNPAVRLAKWVSMIRNRVFVVILLWVIINLSIAGLRKKNVLGSKLWKWTLLIVILSCGYHAISIVIHLCLYFLELICKGKKDKEEVLYYAKGLRQSINLVILSCSLLLIWHFYFRSDHGLKQTSGSDEVFDLGTRTLISLLIFALLWLLKCILLLKWDAHVVYGRFLDRILRAGFQVYFLALMSGKYWVIFRPEENRSSEETQERKARGSQECYEENKNGAKDIPPVGDPQNQEEVPNDNNNVSSGDRTTSEGNKPEKERKAKGSQESNEENENGAKDTPPVGDPQNQEEAPNDNNNVSSGDRTTSEGNKPDKDRKARGSQESNEDNVNGAKDTPPVGDPQNQEEVPNDNNNVTEQKNKKKTAKETLHVEEQKDMLSKDVSTYAIQQMAKYFVALKLSSREGGDATTGIFAKFELDDEEVERLYKQLQEGIPPLEMFEAWLRDLDRDYVTERYPSLSHNDLYTQLQSKSRVPYEKFKDWVVNATCYVTKADMGYRFKLDDKDTELLYKQLQEGMKLKTFEAWLRDRDPYPDSFGYETKRFLSLPLIELNNQLRSNRKVSYQKFKDWVVPVTFPCDHDYVTKKYLSRFFKLDGDDTELLYKQLQDGKSEVSYKMLEDWVMKAFNNCFTLGQTLLDAEKVVNCLNNILNCFVFAMSILSWLLLTEFATTKVLVLIASPLLAASFIFGDTCKAMFEGIIFAFIKHPFDVGDLCVINETEMEVKQINIFTTTFLRLDTKRETLYPNSVLAAQAIINLKFKPDLKDTIELSLDSSTKKTSIDGLEKEIKNYIDKSEKFGGSGPSGHVMVKHIGNNIKIVVHFQHVMSILDTTHSQCCEKKNKQRSEFLLQIKHSLDELKIKTV